MDQTLVGDRTRRLIVWVRYLQEPRRIVGTFRYLANLHMEGVWGETPNEVLAADKASVSSRSPDGIQVLVCQWQKMAFGHNLQAADWHVRFSHTWSYVQHSQGEDRSHRMGREAEVHYIDLSAAKTVDEEILKAIEAKRDYAAHLSRPTVGGTSS